MLAPAGDAPPLFVPFEHFHQSLDRFSGDFLRQFRQSFDY
jgi:hypothetical protein